MITKDEVTALLTSKESFRVERTISTTDKDKFGEAVCAFANDMPDSGKPGYLLIGVHDDGSLIGITRNYVAKMTMALTARHLIRRVGSDRGGHWEVMS